MSASRKPDERYNISNQPARDVSRVNDSSLLILGLEVYECPELKAKFYGTTKQEAEAKAIAALKQAILTGGVANTQPVVKRKPRQADTWRLSKPKNIPSVGTMIGDWEVVGDVERKKAQSGRSIYMIPCKCHCGAIKPQVLSSFVKDPSRECGDCSRKRTARIRITAATKRRIESTPKPGTEINSWEVAGLPFRKTFESARARYVVPCRCKCGHVHDLAIERVSSGDITQCNTCSIRERHGHD